LGPWSNLDILDFGLTDGGEWGPRCFGENACVQHLGNRKLKENSHGFGKSRQEIVAFGAVRTDGNCQKSTSGILN